MIDPRKTCLNPECARLFYPVSWRNKYCSVRCRRRAERLAYIRAHPEKCHTLPKLLEWKKHNLYRTVADRRVSKANYPSWLNPKKV